MPTSTRFTPVVDSSRSPHALLRPVSIYDIQLTDKFLQPRREINRKTTIGSQYRQCETTGRIDNFRRVSGKVDKPFQGFYFNDSDVYKWLEAAATELGTGVDDEAASAIREMVQTVATEIAAAQQPDGYLNSYFALERAHERYTDIKDKHELYCGGHFIQAAVAHHRATGDRLLLDVAIRLADHFDSVFGPEEAGKRPLACGHEELEMALVELYRVTNESRYLSLASFMVDARGHKRIGGEWYYQDDVPFRKLDKMVGHAVRHAYLCCGAADVTTENGDTGFAHALDTQWHVMTGSQSYVTGGIGSRWHGETFGNPYELSSERAYTETCAAIGSFMWNWRMLLRTGEARFSDLMEWTLYNAILPGLSLDGEHYFYQNPLANDGSHRRQAWFGVSCCPPNLARFLAQLPGYFYSTSDAAIWVHLYASNRGKVTLPNGDEVTLRVETDYPWDGKVRVTVETAGDFELNLRVPGWCETGATSNVDGAVVSQPTNPGAYICLRRRWKAGETVELNLPMSPRRIESHPFAAENSNRVALARGPMVYCAEAVDNGGTDLRQLVLSDDAPVTAEHRADLLNGVHVLRASAKVLPVDVNRPLYRTAKSVDAPAGAQDVTFIPYYAWANRAPGRMMVWMRRN